MVYRPSFFRGRDTERYSRTASRGHEIVPVFASTTPRRAVLRGSFAPGGKFLGAAKYENVFFFFNTFKCYDKYTRVQPTYLYRDNDDRRRVSATRKC